MRTHETRDVDVDVLEIIDSKDVIHTYILLEFGSLLSLFKRRTMNKINLTIHVTIFMIKDLLYHNA